LIKAVVTEIKILNKCLSSMQHFINFVVGSWITHTSLSPIQCGFVPCFVNYKKGCTRLAAASDKVYQLLAHGWWFSTGAPASSTTKTGRHDIAESGVKHNKSNQIINFVK
jgi:hypothetical protein